MLAAGNNPDVRYTTRKAHRSRANITLDAQQDDEQAMLTDMKKTRKTWSLPGAAQYIFRARGGEAPGRSGWLYCSPPKLLSVSME